MALQVQSRPRVPSHPIGSVDNALRLLLMFRKRQNVRASEASEALGVARSTAYRLLAMLEYHGLVSQDPDSKTFSTGPTLLEMALAIVRNCDLRTQARPFLEALCAEFKETVHLAILQGVDVLYLDSVESPRPLRVASRVGVTLPAHCTSVGKVLLAGLDQSELRGLYRQAALPALTTRSLASFRALEQALPEVRAAGHAISLGESEDDVVAIGVPVGPAGGRPRAALSLALPMSRHTPEVQEKIVAAMRGAAAKLEASLS
ncbi:MAG: IclR family transcriptional regulator [Chloroflexota bacterium]|nr:IclR family transcriptional regulator [Chloroflexota bacterium]